MDAAVYRRSRTSAELQPADIPQRPQEDTLKLTDQYIALLILVFTKAGLLDVCYRVPVCVSVISDGRMLLPGLDVHVRGVQRWICAIAESDAAYG